MSLSYTTTGCALGAPSSQPTGFTLTGCMSFNSTSLTINNFGTQFSSFLTGAWTIEGFLLYSGSVAETTYPLVKDSGNNMAFVYQVKSNLGSWSTIYETAPNVSYTSPSSAGLTNGVWVHWAISYNNGSGTYMCLNGVAQTNAANNTISSAWTANDLVLGGTGMSGRLCNFRVSNVARYTSTTYTVPTALFGYDPYTIYMNSFNQSSGTNFALTATTYVYCLCAGMLVRTPYGDMPIEKLRTGDLVVTQDGRTVPIVDTVRSVVRGDYYNIPFRIPAHHFAENAPYADVLVSPNHIVYYDKVIVPCQASGFTDETTLLGKDFEYFNVALPNYTTDKMVCQGLEVDSWNTKSKVMY